MVDAVSGFNVFSELMSLVADSKKFSCSITGPLRAYFSVALGSCLAGLFPSLRAAQFLVYHHHSASVIVSKTFSTSFFSHLLPPDTIRIHPTHRFHSSGTNHTLLGCD